MEHKAFKATSAGECSFEAVIAAIGGPPDRDGDVLEPGSLDGQTVAVLVAHDHGSVSLGKATIEERSGQAVAAGELNTEVQLARELCSWLEFDLADGEPIQEWSWAFTINDSFVDSEGIRHLTDVDVMEVSAVLRGAGLATGTLCAGATCGAKGCECEHGGTCGAGRRPEDDPAVVAVRHRVEAWNRDAQKTIKAAEDLAKAHAVAERLKTQGRERVRLLPSPPWVREAAWMVQRDLHITDPPAVRLFQVAEAHQRADLTLPAKSGGVADTKTRTVYIAGDLPLRDAVEALAHEHFHIENPWASEDDATKFGLDYAAAWESGTAYRVKWKEWAA